MPKKLKKKNFFKINFWFFNLAIKKTLAMSRDVIIDRLNLLNTICLNKLDLGFRHSRRNAAVF